MRDELLAFCREAPPEFNDHQRDVFCVFSGNGVGRLRGYLNEQKAHAANEAANGSVTSSAAGDMNSEMGDVDDSNPDSDGVSTPVLNVNIHVQGGIPPGATPAIATPPPPPQHGAAPATLLTQALQNQTWLQNQPHGGGPSNLSQSAPASTGIQLWSAPGAPTGLGIANQSGAQHVTNMMGAAVLDEVDEGDEAFGEGSEIMGD